MNSVLSMMGGLLLPQISKIYNYSREQINNRSMTVVDELIRDSIKNVESLEYVGIRRLTPSEAYETQLSSGNSMNVDISKSSFYKTEIKFKMTHNPDVIIKRLALPYLDMYGRLMSSDISYNIKPIFTDSVISPHASGMFIKLHITKTNISSKPYILSINGVRENLSVIYSDMNRRVIGDSASILNKAITPIAFYVLSNYGILGAIKLITRAELTPVLVDGYEHNPSNGIFYKDIDNQDCKIGFVINIKERLDVIDNLLVAVFYIIKHTYNKSMELYEYIINKNLTDEKLFWTIQFGRFFYKGGLTYDKSTKEIMIHLDKVKNYLDTISRKDLKSIDIDVNDYTDLMLAILDRFNIIILKHKDINADIEQHKNLNVLYYVLNQVIIGINSSFLEIAKREKSRNYHLSTKEVDRILIDNITEKLIFRIVKSTKKNLSIALCNGCTDNLLNYLLVSDDQNRGDGVTVNSNNTFPTSLRNIIPLHFVVGSMHNITKKAPTPLLRLSPFAIVNNNNKFVIPDDLTNMAKDCYGRMRRITEYIGHQIDDIEDENELS